MSDMKKYNVSDLHISKKGRNYTHFMCPMCQNGRQGTRDKGTFLHYHDSDFVNCLDAIKCGHTAIILDPFKTSSIKNNSNSNYNLTNKNMENKVPNVKNEELRKQFIKGTGWLGETKAGKPMIDISISVDDNFSDFRDEMESVADESPDKYKSVYIYEKDENKSRANILFDRQPEGSNRPCWKMMSDDINMWNHGEPVYTDEALAENEEVKSQYRFNVGAFWSDCSDETSDYYSGNVKMAKVLASGKRTIRTRKMILQVLKEKDGNRPDVFLFQNNSKLFEETETTIVTEPPKTEEVKGGVPAEKSSLPIDDAVSADDLPF